MMKVLHVTNAYPSARSPVRGVFVKEQIESLKKDKRITCEAYVIDVPVEGVKSYFKAYLFLLKNSKNFDVVHCHHVLTGVLALFSVPRRKVVVSFMSDGGNNLKGRLSFLGPVVFYVLSRYFKWGLYKAKLPEVRNISDKVLIGNGVNTHFFKVMDRLEARRLLGLSQDKVYLLFVSANSIRKEKRYDIFVNVISCLREKGVDAEELVLSNVDRSKVPLYFNAADCHLLVSDFEGSPNSLKESLSCGTPVVAREVGDVKSVLTKDLESCVLDRSATAEEICLVVERALKLFRSHPNRELLRGKIFDLKLSQDQVAQRIISYYFYILGQNNG